MYTQFYFYFCSSCSSYLFITLFIFSLLLLFITILLSFGCCDEEISPFSGQIKEILIWSDDDVTWCTHLCARDAALDINKALQWDWQFSILSSGAQSPYIVQLYTKFKFELDTYYAVSASVDSCTFYQKGSVFISLFSVLPMWRFLRVIFSQSVIFTELCCPLYLYTTAVHRVLRCEDIRRCAVYCQVHC